MRQHYNGETTAALPIMQGGGRHRAAPGRRGHFTYGAIREALSFQWLGGGKRRKLGGGARYHGITDKIWNELQQSHQAWLRNPGGGRHHFAADAEATVPVMESVGV